MTRWRQVAFSPMEDESWVLEEHCGGEVRQIATVWAAKRRGEPKPWRAQLHSIGIRSNRDYATLEAAKRWTGRRVNDTQ